MVAPITYNAGGLEVANITAQVVSSMLSCTDTDFDRSLVVKSESLALSDSVVHRGRANGTLIRLRWPQLPCVDQCCCSQSNEQMQMQ